MSYLTVYLGSDHVIQQPEYDFQKDYLTVTLNSNDAIRSACKNNAVGVLNSYRIQLDSICVHTQTSQTPDNSIPVDVIVSDDPTNKKVFLCTEKALEQLSFLGASFVQC